MRERVKSSAASRGSFGTRYGFFKRLWNGGKAFFKNKNYFFNQKMCPRSWIQLLRVG